MPISHSCIRYIRSLDQKKVRRTEKVFLAEGPKIVGDLLGRFDCQLLVATSEWLQANRQVAAQEVLEVSAEELSRASLLRTPQQVLGVFKQPDCLAALYAWHWMVCKTLAIWALSSVWLTGLA